MEEMTKKENGFSLGRYLETTEKKVGFGGQIYFDSLGIYLLVFTEPEPKKKTDYEKFYIEKFQNLVFDVAEYGTIELAFGGNIKIKKSYTWEPVKNEAVRAEFATKLERAREIHEKTFAPHLNRTKWGLIISGLISFVLWVLGLLALWY